MTTSPTPTALLVAAPAARGPVHALVQHLTSHRITVTIAPDVDTALEAYAAAASPPCLLLDHSALGATDADTHEITAAIADVIAALPHARPVPVVAGATAARVRACFRAGAGDVLDLDDDLTGEGDDGPAAVVARVCASQRQRAAEAAVIASQRSMIDELLKDLVKTERRTIDVEERLARQRRITGEQAPQVESRAPSILLVEHERGIADELADLLEDAGVTTFAYVTGEEAVRGASNLAATEGLDLALVAVQLPGIDGLETVRRLRAKIPGLPAFLITSVIDAGLAATAANLGVVGFVEKPLADLDDVVARLAALARESLDRSREHAYLERIKERHERVLARYRALPREP